MQGNDGQGISTVWIVAHSLSREYDGPAARGRGAAYGSTVGAQALSKTRSIDHEAGTPTHRQKPRITHPSTLRSNCLGDGAPLFG